MRPARGIVECHTSRVELRRATRADQDHVRALLDAYLRELSTHRDIGVGAVDADTYPYFEVYWSEPGRYPFIIEADGHTVGFAFIRGPDSTGSASSEVAEFSIAPGSRRRGIGRAAVAAIWRAFPGPWELQVHAHNEAAVRFWSACIASEACDAPRITEVHASDGRRFQYNFTVIHAA